MGTPEIEDLLAKQRKNEKFDSICSGTAGGFGYFFLKGIYESPKGSPIVDLLERGCRAARFGAPQFAGYSILISTLFVNVDSIMDFDRKKDDVFNKLTAGAACVGLLKFPHRFCGLGIPARSIVLGIWTFGVMSYVMRD